MRRTRAPTPRIRDCVTKASYRRKPSGRAARRKAVAYSAQIQVPVFGRKGCHQIGLKVSINNSLTMSAIASLVRRPGVTFDLSDLLSMRQRRKRFYVKSSLQVSAGARDGQCSKSGGRTLIPCCNALNDGAPAETEHVGSSDKALPDHGVGSGVQPVSVDRVVGSYWGICFACCPIA
jgi:hypothetical protein